MAKYISGYTNKEVIAFVKMKLGLSVKWAAYACVKIADKHQTISEKRTWIAKERNKLGFCKYDTPILNGIAKRLQRGKTISDSKAFKNYDVQKRLMTIMPRYARQVILLCNVEKLKKDLDRYYHKDQLELPF